MAERRVLGEKRLCMGITGETFPSPRPMDPGVLSFDIGRGEVPTGLIERHTFTVGRDGEALDETPYFDS